MKFLGELLLKRKKGKLNRKVYFNRLSEAKTALIVYNANNPERRKEVKDFIRFFKEERLAVESIGYYGKVGKNIEKPQDELGDVYFDKKELSPYKFPKNRKIKKLISKQFDILIDLNLNEEFCLEVISSLSKAKFKVGPNHKYGNEVFDLTLETKDKPMSYLMEQIKVYLGMINK